jgi:hypothetical protein
MVGHLWFGLARRDYACCIVDRDRPTLTTACLHFDGWLDAGQWRFRQDLALVYGPSERPSVVTYQTHDISSRLAVLELQLHGLHRLDELRARLGGLATWLAANCLPEDLFAPHEGTLKD